LTRGANIFIVTSKLCIVSNGIIEYKTTAIKHSITAKLDRLQNFMHNVYNNENITSKNNTTLI